MTDVEVLVDGLAADPMYQLSTAGQELFHTNMLFWLATQRPGPSAPVWRALHVDAPPAEGPEAAGPIRREWRHLDLYLDSGIGGRKLVLENKVLAVATAAQLKGYRDRLLADNRWVAQAAPVTSWVVLTLLPLTFDAPEPWLEVTYADLVAPLDQTAAALSVDAATANDAILVGLYARLVGQLVALSKAVDIASRLDEPVALPAHLLDRLQEARLSALVQKLRATRCAALLSQRLKEQHAGMALTQVKADLTRGQALLEAFVPGPHGRQFGWQVQGSQVRLAMLTSAQHDAPTVAGRNRAAEAHADYFMFDDLTFEVADVLGPYTGRKTWLGYGHEFVYRYLPLRRDTTWRQLLELTTYLTTRALAYTAGGVGASAPTIRES